MHNLNYLVTEEDERTRKLEEAFDSCELVDMYYISMGFVYSVGASIKTAGNYLKEKAKPAFQKILEYYKKKKV